MERRSDAIKFYNTLSGGMDAANVMCTSVPWQHRAARVAARALRRQGAMTGGG